ncbi:response regulator transcription factor [Microbacterium hominis]|uniref:Response regulator transcription factor n=1 Tax=Microbacterium hominis TaxID=162426 RepID=A0A7D4PU44_9MICO|nr:response regulator transcription factor [Microbacterium hominis]QKJ19034.1 response regulator transcription factor [Microbacterium hominis]
MRVVVADDSLLMRRGIVETVRGGGHDVVGEAGDVAQLMGMVSDAMPDAAIIDIRMPPTHTTEGLDAAQRIRAELPATAVLVLSQYVESAYAERLIEESPNGIGYLIKDRILDAHVLLDALDRVHHGQCVVDPTIVAQLLARIRRDDPLARLSAREREVLSYLAEGLTNRAIASAMFVTERTIETHVRNVFDKLGLVEGPDQHRRVLAVLTFLRG